MSKIRIWSRACFAIGPGASRDGKVIDTFYTVPGAFQDMDERYMEDPTFKAAVDSGDIQIMTAKPQVAVDVPHVEAPSVDGDADASADPIEEYKEKVKAMSAEEMAKNHSYLFCDACTAKIPPKCEKTGFVNGLSPCSQCVLKWLNSEVEE